MNEDIIEQIDTAFVKWVDATGLEPTHILVHHYAYGVLQHHPSVSKGWNNSILYRNCLVLSSPALWDQVMVARALINDYENEIKMKTKNEDSK